MLDDVVITQHINTYEALLQSLSAIAVVVSDENMTILETPADATPYQS